MSLVLRHVAEVFSAAGAASGYLIANDLVLTAGHAISDGLVTVRFATDDEEFSATPVWRGTELDAAVIRLDQPGPSTAPVRFGRITGTGSVVSVRAVGFPESQRDATAGWRDVEDARGQVAAGTGLISRRYQVLVTGLPAETRRGASPWAGMSGAALWSGDLIIGVVVEDPVQYQHGRITAEPAYRLFADAGFMTVVAGSRMSPYVESVELASVFTHGRRGAFASPAELLHASRAIVPFDGRTVEIGDLERWCADGGAAMRLVHGPGGQGKTRLAHKFVQNRRNVGWSAGFLADNATLDAEVRAALTASAAPTLLVVDYAETRSALVQELAAASPVHEGGPAFRILLLARAAGDWWEAMESVAGLRMASQPLRRLHGTVEERPAAYRRAVRAFAGGLRHIEGYEDVDWPAVAATRLPKDLAAEGSGHALSLHAAALSELLQAGPRPVTEGPVRDVLLRHEARYWSRTAAAHRLDLSDRTLGLAVATATLCGPAGPAEARAILGAVDLLRDQPSDVRLRVEDWLRSLYPTVSGAAWAPLEPDRLGERLVARYLGAGATWPEDIVMALDDDMRQRALTVLSRAAIDHPDAAETTARLVAESSAMAFAALAVAPQAEHPEPLVDGLTRWLGTGAAIPLDDLAAACASLPVRTIVLSVWSARATEELVRRHRLVAAPGRELATELIDLSRRQAATGRNSDGLASAEEAVAMLSEQVVSNDIGVLRLLGDALNALSNRLEDAGQSSAALDPAEQEMAVALRLNELNAKGADVMLARAYNNLGVRRAAVHRAEDGLSAVLEAVRLRRKLAETDRLTYLPELGVSINNLAVRYANVGELEKALATIEEAIRIRRELSRQRPDAHLPSLALSLNNQAARLSDLGRAEEALASIAECVAIRRRLADAHPERYRRSLALSLANLAARLATLGRYDEALAASEEGVQLRREVLANDPSVSGRALASALNMLARRLQDAGRVEEAVAAAQESVAMGRDLVQRDSAYAFELARHLKVLATLSHASGRTDEAFPYLSEAVALYRTNVAAAGKQRQADLVAAVLYQAELHAADDDKRTMTALLDDATQLISVHDLAAFRPALVTELERLKRMSIETPDPGNSHE